MFSYILLGIIQGITEFLPVSSSGHLIILKDFLGVEQSLVLDVTLHLATLIAVVIFYREKLISLLSSFLSSTPAPEVKKDKKLVYYLIVATIPAAVMGFLFDDFFEQIRSSFVVSIMLILVSLLMLIDYLSKSSKKTTFNYKNSILIGFAQVLAMIPGTSRSGITIVTGSLLGIDKKEAADFTFLLSVPIIFGAFIFKIFDITDYSYFLNLNVISAFVAALVSGYFSIGLLLNLLKKYGFLPFIVYRLLLATVILLTVLI